MTRINRAGDHPGEDDITRCMDAVRAIVRALRFNSRGVEKKIGIGLAQLFVLQEVAERPANSLNDLAKRTATHQSSVSAVVQRLVSRDLVRRTPSPADGRVVRVAASPAGRDLLRGAPRTVPGRLIGAMEHLTPTERRKLADLLERWVQAAGIDQDNAPMMDDEAVVVAP